MWSFQYKNGDRPLEGFTIQRAAGRGGFGEVYYALSDSGREVALKAVQGYEQIELRGISQCMNLKSPHLVTIFDVKYNDQGKPFVIMEYVSGPSLRQLLDESPAGLGTQKSAFFLREIGKGLTFLHECGIVHRDLKPGNVFFENGYVKIGDYGLSKAISPTQHSGQTVTVGTVHYMAPEIGVGKYDRSIDIYAMGAVLYEMLTGTVPFIGASPSEILMKHLQSEPDMSGVPEPFNTVIRKAMAKNPADRYQSVQEMVEAVFGADHVRMSVSCFSPEDLSMVAGRVAQKVAIGGGGNGGGSSSVVGAADDIGARLQDRMAEVRQRLQDSRDQLRERLQDRAAQARERLQRKAERIRERFGSGLDDVPPIPNADTSAAINDALPLFSRQMLGLLTAVVVSIAAGLLVDSRQLGNLSPITVPVFVFLAVVSASLSLLVGWRHIVIPKLRRETHTVRKLTIGIIVSAATLIGSGLLWLVLKNQGRFHDGTWIAILAPLWSFNTWEWCRANRRERVSLGPAIWAAFVGFILCGPFDGDPVLTIAILAGTALVVQVVAPWDPQLAANRRSTRKNDYSADAPPSRVYGNVTVTSKEAQAMRAAGTEVYGNLNISDAPKPPPVIPASIKPVNYIHVPPFAPYIWLGMFISLLTIGLMLLIGAGMEPNLQAPPVIGSGVMAIVAALFCFARIFKKRFYGWWSYAARPVLMFACIGTIVIASLCLADSQHFSGDDRLGPLFFIIFPSLLLLTIPFLPRRFGSPPGPSLDSRPTSPHSRGLALGMATLGLCGACGVQRFVVGKIGTGIMMVLTGGLFGIGQLVDVIMICTGKFTDAEGRVLRVWDTDPRALRRATAKKPPAVPPVPDAPVASADGAADAANPAPPQWTPPVPPVPARAPRTGAVTGGLLSAITALLVLATLVVSLAIGFDLPLALASGLPDPHTANDIHRHLFGNSQVWQMIGTQLLWVALVVLGLITAGMMMAARRRTCFTHIFRGLLGIAGLLWAVSILTSTFHKDQGWIPVADYVHANLPDKATQTFFQYFTDGHPIGAAAICVAALLMLSIPYHRPPVEQKGLA